MSKIQSLISLAVGALCSVLHIRKAGAVEEELRI